MINKILAFFTLLIISTTSFAQINTVRDGSVNFKDVNRYCVEFEVEAVSDEIIGEWKKHLKKNYKVKLKKYVGGYYLASETIYTKISNKNIDLYTTTEVMDTTTVLKVFAAFENGVFLNQIDHLSEINRLKIDVKTFLSQFVEDYYDSVLKPLLKKKKKIEKDLSKTEKDLAKADKALKKNKATIKKNDDKISAYQAKIDKYTQKIEELNTDIETGTVENEVLVQENTVTEEEVKVLDVENDENKKKLEAINKEIQAVERKK